MASTTKFILPSDFDDYSDISQYINAKYVDIHILAAQDSYIKPLLGDTLYEELQTQKEADALTYVNADLINELTPYLIYKTTAEYIPHANFFATNMGIRVYTEDNSRAANDKEISLLVKYAQNKADTYENELRRFLADNAGDYPDYVIANQPEKIVMPRIGKIGKPDRNIDRRRYL